MCRVTRPFFLPPLLPPRPLIAAGRVWPRETRVYLYLYFAYTTSIGTYTDTYTGIGTTLHSIFDTTPYANETEQNIEAMRTLICQKALLPTTTDSNRGLVNVFSGVVATPEQAHDLLTFRKVVYKTMKIL